MGSRRVYSRNAQARGQVRRRRRKRAERRRATEHIREKVNERMRAAGHPGWGEQPSKRWLDWNESTFGPTA